MFKQGDDTMNIEAKQKALSLVERNPLVMMLGTVGPNGASEIKAMVKMRNDGLRRFWFCSNTSAQRNGAKTAIIAV